MQTKAYIQLIRPANIVTAIADILAGIAIAAHQFGGINYGSFILIISTIGLYGGGVVLNDAFDAKLDAVERPERPIPSRKISVGSAMNFGYSLLAIGCVTAFFNSITSGIIAICIALLAIIYNSYGKHQSIFGPINMGLCRGGNLLLGISAVPMIVPQVWFLALIPIVYIAAITMVSSGEVHGGNPKTLYAAGLLYLFVIATQLFFAYRMNHQFYFSVMLLITFALFIFIPLINAIKNPIGPNIGKAVKAGVISLILMDAVWSIACGNIYLGLITISLLPISILLSKFFAVT